MALSFAHHKEATFKDGCLSLRKNVLDKMREQNGPGPIYSPAPRVSSKEKSLRNIIFGTGPARYNDEPKHTKRRIPQSCHHPGPQTYDPDAIRNAICNQSKQRSAAGVKFGSSKRYDDKNNNYPSPAEYDPDMIRRGIMFSKSRSTSVKFGTARNSDNKRSALPGPASYDPDNIRKGIMFTKSTMPSVKFGNPPKKMSTTDHQKKYEVRNHTPGPQGTFFIYLYCGGHQFDATDLTFLICDCIYLLRFISYMLVKEYDTERIRRGICQLSTKRQPVGVKFSTGPRTYNDAEERERSSKPGPSTYNVRSALGQQVNSRYRSQPALSFGAR